MYESVYNQLETGNLQSLWVVTTALQVQFNIEIAFGQANKIKIKHERSDLKLLSFEVERFQIMTCWFCNQ